MAGTVKVIQSIQVTNGNSILPAIGASTQTHVQDAVGGPTPGAIATSTTATAVDLSELGTEGWIRLKNLDDTDSIHWGPDSGGSTLVEIGTLEPGESALFRLFVGATLMLDASANTPICEVLAFED